MLTSMKLKLASLVMASLLIEWGSNKVFAQYHRQESIGNKREAVNYQTIGFGKAIALGLEKVSYEYASYWERYIKSERMQGEVNNESTLEDWARRACNEAGETIDIAEVHRHFYLLYVDFVIGFTHDQNIEAYTLGTTSSSSLVDPEEIYGLVLQEAVTIKCPDKKITGVLNLKQ
jgi:hypothetical protein